MTRETGHSQKASDNVSSAIGQIDTNPQQVTSTNAARMDHSIATQSAGSQPPLTILAFKFAKLSCPGTFKVGDEFHIHAEHFPGQKCLAIEIYELPFDKGRHVKIDYDGNKEETPESLKNGRDLTKLSFKFTNAEIGTWKWLVLTTGSWASNPSTSSRFMIEVSSTVEGKE